MRVNSSYSKQLEYIIKINKFNKLKMCDVCKSVLICELCKRYGRTEGQKWREQQKSYTLE